MPRQALAPVWKIMKAPGEGLLTVSTGPTGLVKRIQKRLVKKHLKNWGAHVYSRLTHKEQAPGPSLIGFPSDSGGGICRGAAHAPLALRPLLYANGWSSHDLGDIPCIPQLSHDKLLSRQQQDSCVKALWGRRPASKSIPCSPLNLLSELLTFGFHKQGRSFKPLVLGGDHSVSWACIDALQRSGMAKSCALLHLDAHTDLLQHRFGVEYCFATWARHALKSLENPKQLVQVGLRRSAKSKAYWERTLGIRQFWMSDLRSLSSITLAQRIIEHFRSLGCKHLYISIDIDAIDPKFAPCTGTPEPNGLSLAYAKDLISRVSKAIPLLGADLVEIAPVLGSPRDSRRTLDTGVQLIDSLYW